MRCGWCGSDAAAGATNCARCGGPLGSALGAGPRPPDAPRDLPARFVRRELVTGNTGVWFGAAWCALTGIFPALFTVLSCANPVMAPAALLSLVFPVPGVIIGVVGYRKARRRVDVLRHGRSATGTVDGAGPDTSVTVNGAHPWKLQYLFDADGRRLAGAVSSLDPGARAFAVGAPVHVVYLPEDPERNDLWPPLPR